MNRLIEAHGGRRLYIPVGLPELINDIGKEVLKNQPENLLKFIADYLEKRVEDMRSQKCLEKARSGSEGSLPMEIKIILDECGIDVGTATHAATIIQAAFRGHKARQRLKQEEHDGQDIEKENLGRNDMKADTPNETFDDKFPQKTSFDLEYARMSTSTIGSTMHCLPHVDYRAGNLSFDQMSTYDDVSILGERFDGDREPQSSIVHLKTTQSVQSTNTIMIDDRFGELKTYLDLTMVKEESPVDPFQQFQEQSEELNPITSDLEILKNIDLDEYEEPIGEEDQFGSGTSKKFDRTRSSDKEVSPKTE